MGRVAGSLFATAESEQAPRGLRGPVIFQVNRQPCCGAGFARLFQEKADFSDVESGVLLFAARRDDIIVGRRAPPPNWA